MATNGIEELKIQGIDSAEIGLNKVSNITSARSKMLLKVWLEKAAKKKSLLSTASILPLAACGGSDPSILKVTDGMDISDRVGLEGYTLDFQNSLVGLTMTVEQHNSVSMINLNDEQTIILSNDGTLTTRPGVENYDIVEGSTLIIASGSGEVNVTENRLTNDSDISTVDIGGRTITGNYVDFDSADILKVTQSANISGAKGNGNDAGSALGFGVIDFGNADGVTLTLTLAQHDSFSVLENTQNAQTFALTTAGAVTARAGIENYTLHDAGGNTITVLEATNVDARASSADTINVGNNRVTGTYQTTANDVILAVGGADISGAAIGALINLDLGDDAGIFTMSQAQHQQLVGVINVDDVQSFVLTTAGEITARTGIENYRLHNADGNNITVLETTNVDANAESKDTITVGSKAVTGTYQTTENDVISATGGADISGAVIGASSNLDLGNSAGEFTMSLAQHEQLTTLSNADGIQTFVLTTAGEITARSGIENYTLHDSVDNNIAVLESTNVDASSAQIDIITVGNKVVTGRYETTTNDVISASGGADISGATIGAVTNLALDDHSGTFTMTQVQHQQLASVTNVNGVQTFEITTAGEITARNGIENYKLSNDGGSTFTQSATATPVKVTSGTGKDLIITDAADVNRGKLTIDLSLGGNDTVRIQNDTGSVASPSGLVAGNFGGFGGTLTGEKYNDGSLLDTSADWKSSPNNQQGSDTFVDIIGFVASATDSGRDMIQLSKWTGGFAPEVNTTTTNLNAFNSGSIFEINASSFTVSGDQFGNLETIATMLDNLSNVNDGEYYIVVYNGNDINADAALYFARATEGDGFDFSDTNGATGGHDTDSVELLAVFYSVGANEFSSLNFESIPLVA